MLFLRRGPREAAELLAGRRIGKHRRPLPPWLVVVLVVVIVVIVPLLLLLLLLLLLCIVDGGEGNEAINSKARASASPDTE